MGSIGLDLVVGFDEEAKGTVRGSFSDVDAGMEWRGNIHILGGPFERLGSNCNSFIEKPAKIGTQNAL